MRRVLVVDDDRDIRELLRVVLESDGYTVETVNDGVAALEVLTRTDEIWIVLLDINMPRMTGLEVCARLSALDTLAARHIVVLMTAGRFPDGDAPPPVRALLPKPFDLHALQARIAELADVELGMDVNYDSRASDALDSITVMGEPERRVA
jgi:CheY-like chemotaxis protein